MIDFVAYDVLFCSLFDFENCLQSKPRDANMDLSCSLCWVTAANSFFVESNSAFISSKLLRRSHNSLSVKKCVDNLSQKLENLKLITVFQQ